MPPPAWRPLRPNDAEGPRRNADKPRWVIVGPVNRVQPCADRSWGPPFTPRAPRPSKAREEATLPVPTAPLTGDALLEGVNDAMVELHERYHHRAPVTARTQLIGDEILACVMSGIYTDVEKTLIELEQQATVRHMRSVFQRAMKDRFIAAVQQLSGRRVRAFICDSHVGPDLQIELFILEPAE